MTKLANLIKNILGALVLVVMWVIYVPYATCKALIHIEGLKEFADDVLIAIGNIRFEAASAFRKRSTHNAVIKECMNNLKRDKELKESTNGGFLTIYHFLEKQYK